MKHLLKEPEKNHLKNRVAETEKMIQAQIVLATMEKCDTYQEIPWKAFALGSIFTTFPVLAVLLRQSGWMTPGIFLNYLLIIFLSGAVMALLTILIPAFARLFLSRNRAFTETNQYAGTFFLNRELFDTPGREAILILVSAFEKQVIILPDKGVRDRLAAADLQKIISGMTVLLAGNKARDAFELALDELNTCLKTAPDSPPSANTFTNDIIEEKGI